MGGLSAGGAITDFYGISKESFLDMLKFGRRFELVLLHKQRDYIFCLKRCSPVL